MKKNEKKPVVIRMVKIVKWLFIVLLFVFINIKQTTVIVNSFIEFMFDLYLIFFII